MWTIHLSIEVGVVITYSHFRIKCFCFQYIWFPECVHWLVRIYRFLFGMEGFSEFCYCVTVYADQARNALCSPVIIVFIVTYLPFVTGNLVRVFLFTVRFGDTQLRRF